MELIFGLAVVALIVLWALKVKNDIDRERKFRQDLEEIAQGLKKIKEQL